MASTVKDTSAERSYGTDDSVGAPMVSFIVLCYNLAHLLPDCVRSILSQTYCDFEVIIMDDCSPDNTAEVAKSFHDPRVRHVRNDRNLGVLGNQNEGIRLSRGKYVWIISADDYLRQPYILQRYVDLMEKHPQVGYAFCSGVGVKDGKETGVLGYSKYRNRDGIIKGHVFLKRLLCGNNVLAASAMARRECYEKISVFPLDVTWGGAPIDMIWAADWYLWCLFAVSFDVAYFAEPMVCYREHNLSVTSSFTQKDKIELCVAADIAVPWLVREKADEHGFKSLSRNCLRAVANEYARHGGSKQYRGSVSSMSVDDFEKSLCRGTDNERERNWIRARFYAAKGDRLYSKGDLKAARRFYLDGLRNDPRMVSVYPKLLLSLGRLGVHLRRLLRTVRRVRYYMAPNRS
jgi:glycosyltransferase involved in cell wall biosynthesis